MTEGALTAKLKFTAIRTKAGAGRRSRTLAVSRKRQGQSRRLCAPAAPPSDEIYLEATRLSSAYNLRIPRRGKADSAGNSFPSAEVSPRPFMCRWHISYAVRRISFIICRRHISFICRCAANTLLPLHFLRAPSVPLWLQITPRCRQQRKAPLL